MTQGAAGREALVDYLLASGRAAFLRDLVLLLQREGGCSDEVESDLRRLEEEGVVLIREHAWNDPHLEGEDLRVVGLLDRSAVSDPIAACIQAIESTWSAWLAGYLAEHRCS